MTNLAPRSLLKVLLAVSSTIIMVADTTMVAHPARAINVVPLTVRTPHAGFNRMVVSVTMCDPGTEHCATIDDIMVDTGSTGLRLEASAMPSSLTLPAFTGPDGKPLAECLRFVHDDAWGPLYRADLRIGGLRQKTCPFRSSPTISGRGQSDVPHPPLRRPRTVRLGLGRICLIAKAPARRIRTSRASSSTTMDRGCLSKVPFPLKAACRTRFQHFRSTRTALSSTCLPLPMMARLRSLVRLRSGSIRHQTIGCKTLRLCVSATRACSRRAKVGSITNRVTSIAAPRLTSGPMTAFRDVLGWPGPSVYRPHESWKRR